MTNDRDILGHINELVDEEQRLREQRVGHGLDAAAGARLKVVEEQLDQCWDLLRQRRANEEFGRDPNATSSRPVDVVENYEQ